MKVKLITFLLFFSTLNQIVLAEEVNNLLVNANHCTKYYDIFEKQYGIPNNLLKAISLVETGRWIKEIKTPVPSPWAVSDAGKAHYFNNKQEAINKVKELIRQGKTNIDVGCMQINLKHHHEAFKTLEEAFDPQYNIHYAAKFLIERYKKESNWHKAVSAYHSYTKPLGEKYLSKVVSMFKNYANFSYPYSTHTNLVNVQESPKPIVNRVIIPKPKNLRRIKSPIIVSIN